jgi:REP element-mobilizing transposase RayT
MARKPRIHFPGAIYHAIARGNGGKRLFFDDDDYRYCTNLLIDMKRFGARFFAYCLMPNHIHLLIQVGSTPLSKLMHGALTRYAMHFNEKQEIYGHVFQGRYKDLLVQRDEYFVSLINYIHNNPVRAGLVASAEAWPWSGHRGFLGLEADPLLTTDGGIVGTDGIAVPEQDLCLLLEHREMASRRPPLDELARIIASEYGVEIGAFAQKCQERLVTKARREFMVMARDEGYERGQIAAYLGCTPWAIDKATARRRNPYNFPKPDPDFGDDQARASAAS